MIRQYLEVGQIVSTHGVKGEVKVNPWCDSPDFLKKLKTLYFDKDGQKPIKVKSSRVHKNVVLINLDGIDSIEKASALRNKILYMNRKDAKLDENSFFIQDLIGCLVLDADSGKSYGELSDVSSTGANDVWHIKQGSKEYLIPAIPDVVIETKVEENLVIIRPLKGIFDDED